MLGQLKYIIVVLVFQLIVTVVDAQITEQLTSESRRARRAYERAAEAYRLFDNYAAVKELKKALNFDHNFIEAHLLLAEIYFHEGDYEKSIEPWQSAVFIDSLFFPAARYYLGSALFRSGHYEKALESFNIVLQMKRLRPAILEQTEKYLESCHFALSAIENPVPFNPVNPGPAINSQYSEYSPALTADEKTLIFTRKKALGRLAEHDQAYYYEDFYISTFVDGAWSEARNLGPPLNTTGNEGAQTITADGRHMYFTACNRPDGFGSCDIYYASLQGGVYSKPVNVGLPLNSSAWDSQPSVSSDGQTIYFASSRPGNIGITDIWMATRNADGNWNMPQNLGPVINTTGSELSPFIHHDNQTLYFASDGHPGMGGLDIFYSRRCENGQWGEPVNIGYPVNTHGDEFGMIVGASGMFAWFASDKEGGFGNSDLYIFELYEEARPQMVTYMKGVVYDSENLEPLHVSFKLKDVKTGELIIKSSSDPIDGSYLVAIPTGKELALNVSKTGYLFFSENFNYKDPKTAVAPYIRDIPLQPIDDGHTIVLRNVFFEIDSYQLEPASYPELERLLLLLQQNQEITIEVSGHTDNTGSYDHNLLLSQNRARSVRNFLTGKGVSPKRIHYKGYADTRPVDTNDTPEGRANNRRTEIQILSH